MKKVLAILGLGTAFGLGCAGAGVLVALGLALGIAINAVIALLLTTITYFAVHFVAGITLPFIKVWAGTTAGITVLTIIRRFTK